MYYAHCSVLCQWLCSILHTLPYSPLCFGCSQPPDSLNQTFHGWLPHLFCVWPLYIEGPSPPSPTETHHFTKTIDLPPFPLRAAVFLRRKLLFVFCFKFSGSSLGNKQTFSLQTNDKTNEITQLPVAWLLTKKIASSGWKCWSWL